MALTRYTHVRKERRSKTRCKRKLFYREQDKPTGKHIWLCSFCNIEFVPDNELVKKASKFSIPEGSDPSADKTPIVVMGDEPAKASSTSYVKQKLSKSFEALEKAGYHFTNYEER